MTTFNDKMVPTMRENYRLMESYYPSYHYPSVPQSTVPFHNVNPFMHQPFHQMTPFPPTSQMSSSNDLNAFLRQNESFNVTSSQDFSTSHDKPLEEDNFAKANGSQNPSLYNLIPARTKKKPGKPVPEEKKDKTYWEKRNKNNRSAKRSRETRRNRSKIVDEEILVKTNQLEMSKIKLRSLMEEERRLRIMYTERGLQCPY